MTPDEGPTGPRPRRISLVITDEHGEVLRETRPAIFIDRDGTLIQDVGYIKNPDDVKLMPGAPGALRAAHNVQRPVVLVTNQSGIARGLFTLDDYEAVKKRTTQLLAEFSAYLDGEYMCPHHPDFTGPCLCRKPGVELFERAIREHGLDGSASTFIGDRWRDVVPAVHFGGRGILVPTPATPADEVGRARAEMSVAGTLQEAVDLAIADRATGSAGA